MGRHRGLIWYGKLQKLRSCVRAAWEDHPLQLDSDQQAFGEGPLVVHPLRLRAEAARYGQFRYLRPGVLVAALRPDGFARREGDGEASKADIDHLRLLRPQVHLD